MSREIYDFAELPEAGYCVTCTHCDGIDNGRCVCRLGDRRAKWRYDLGDEKCPKWEADEVMCSLICA